MPQSKKPGWINWRNSAPREIILEDLDPGGFLFGKDDMPATVAWEHYKGLEELNNPPVAFDQFEVCLKDYRKKALRRAIVSTEEEKMFKHDRKIYADQLCNHRGQLVFA
jgi:hypothetical protein